MAKKTCGLKLSGLKTLLLVVPIAILGYLLYKHLHKINYIEGLDSKSPTPPTPTPPTPPTSPTPLTPPTPPTLDVSGNSDGSLVDFAKLDPRFRTNTNK